MTKTNAQKLKRQLQQQKANRVGRHLALQGDGDYRAVVSALKKMLPDGTFSKIGGSIGGTAGGLLGGRLGLPGPGAALGSAAGHAMGRKFATLVGAGDYSVSENSIFKDSLALPHGADVPRMHMGDGSIVVAHREYISNITIGANPTAFEVREYFLSPSNPKTFPWLSEIAKRFQQFEFLGLVFCFVTNTSGYSAAGSLGKIAIATNYDVSDATATAMIPLLNMEYSVSGPPSNNLICTIECKESMRAQRLLYTSGGEARSGSVDDPRLENLGVMQVATEGLPGSAGDVIGGLWVSYEVRLLKPILKDQAGQKISDAAATVSDFYGSATSTGESLVSYTANTLTFLVEGDFFIEVILTGSSTPGISAVTGTASGSQVTQAGEATKSVNGIYVANAAPGETVIFTGANTVTSTITRVMRYNMA